MGFKRVTLREILLISLGLFLLFIVFIINHGGQSHAEVTAPVMAPPVPAEPLSVPAAMDFDDKEDQALTKELKDQMDADRTQQRQIKVLKMRLEQADLQLENEKALAEINKLKREDTGDSQDTNLQANGFPSVKVIYIGGTEIQKEAILSIGGTNYSVKPKDKPVESMEVLGITDDSVKVHFTAPLDFTTVVNYTLEG